MNETTETPTVVTDEPKVALWRRPVNFVKKHARPIIAISAVVAATAATTYAVVVKGKCRSTDESNEDEPTVVIFPVTDEESAN